MREKEYSDLLESIVKGAEYIETLSPTDPKWKKANEKYDRLVAQARAVVVKEAGHEAFYGGGAGNHGP